MAQQKHDFHLVDPSIWPILSAFAAGFMAICAVLYMHPDMKILNVNLGLTGVIAGFAVLCFLAFRWWRDVVREAHSEGHHTPIVRLHHRYGMILFIASEVMFFAAFFWAFFDASLYPKEATGGVWPPKGISPFDPFHLPLFNTLVLLLSGTTVTWAHHSLLEGNRKGLIQGLICTVLLGALFTCVQAYEYHHAAFTFKDGVYPSTFFMATGFHGFHVMIGTTFLLVCLIRSIKGHFTPEQHFGLEAAAWYWHFVDVVWLFLFAAVYWWGA
ncbi:MAG: cytochrome c oxidase subunit 3 [Alphaproteobacteria bacterium]|nr:MAG: cytochrome c oxidase subunit 3 [Alphaproteobacteria bacterium]